MLNRALMVLFLCASCLAGLDMRAQPAFAQSKAETQLSRWALETLPERIPFTQERYLSVLSRPIVSRGVITRRDSQAIVWHQTEPINVTMVLGPDGIEAAGDNPQAALQAAVAPIAAAISDMFYGRYGNLATLFDIKDSAGRVTLMPLASPLSKIMARIELAGEEHLERITLVEKTGDYTVIRLSPAEPEARSE